MAYDQYMYPMEQPGYQPPPMPDAFQWLMNNPYIGPGSIPPSDFSIVDQGIPNAMGNLQQVGQDYAQAGRGMAQRMQTMTPDYPLGQGFMPTPEPAPQFDPSMVANPGLSFPPGPPGAPPPQAGPAPSQIGPGGVYEPGMDQAPPQPPTPMPQLSQGIDTQPAFGLTDQMEPPQVDIPPTPMESWMMDYNQQTDDYVKAQQEQAKSAMWIQMGQALLANMGSPELALAGMGQAVAQRGANRPAMEQYRQGRESERLDLLYKMEQIRKSQQPREYAQRAPVVKDLPDGTVYQVHPDGSIGYGGRIYSQAEFNDVSRAADARALAEKHNWKQQIKGMEKEAAIEATMEKFDVDREMAETMVGFGGGAEAPAGQVDVPDPGQAGTKAKADVLRQKIIATKDPAIQHFLELDDEELLEWANSE